MPLRHLDPFAGEVAGKAGAVAADALHADLQHRIVVAAHPRDQVAIRPV